MIRSIQAAIMWAGVAALAALALWPVLKLVGHMLRRAFRLLRGMNIFEAICSLVATFLLWAYAAEKHEVVPTVKGITLGFPMESPTGVHVEWGADEGQTIHSNDAVKVYWRNAEGVATSWQLGAEGIGITNAFVSGFFLDRNTDWMVVVEPHQDEEETPEEEEEP